jgi:hypothetical protein
MTHEHVASNSLIFVQIFATEVTAKTMFGGVKYLLLLF